MSSSIGHSLIAISIQRATEPTDTKAKWVTSFWWTLCLVIVANFPDVGRVLEHVGGIRPEITHLLAFVLVLPTLLLPLVCWAAEGRERMVAVVQLFATSISHIAADLLVGVKNYQLFWPFSDCSVRLPFGFLPSSPGVSLFNPYLYRNLVIELAILLPLFYFSGWRKVQLWQGSRKCLTIAALSSFIAGACVAYHLDRP